MLGGANCSAASNNDVYVELLDEIITLYEEDSQMNRDLKTFVGFIENMLPIDVLLALQKVTGGGTGFLDDIWSEKYEPKKTDIVDVDDDESGLIESEQLSGRECAVCERQVRLTRHHLIPRVTHRTMHKKGYSSELLQVTIPVCRLCHSAIHRFFSNEDLANHYNTLDRLLAEEKFFKFARWASTLSDRRYAGDVGQRH